MEDSQVSCFIIFSGLSGVNEKHHKYFVKGNAKLTQRISSKFASQLSRNDYDRVVIDGV